MKPTRPTTAPAGNTNKKNSFTNGRGRGTNNTSARPSSSRNNKSKSLLQGDNNKNNAAVPQPPSPLNEPFTLPESIDNRLAKAARIYGNPTNVHHRRIIDGNWIRNYNNGHSLMNVNNSARNNANNNSPIDQEDGTSPTKAIRDKSPTTDNRNSPTT